MHLLDGNIVLPIIIMVVWSSFSFDNAGDKLKKNSVFYYSAIRYKFRLFIKIKIKIIKSIAEHARKT